MRLPNKKGMVHDHVVNYHMQFVVYDRWQDAIQGQVMECVLANVKYMIT
jgi:hypothetical protein